MESQKVEKVSAVKIDITYSNGVHEVAYAESAQKIMDWWDSCQSVCLSRGGRYDGPSLTTLLSKDVKRPVLQEWVCDLTFMQQSVLIASVRGPDTIHKNHVAKLLLRWLRRCILLSAFDAKVLGTDGILVNPYMKGGGSFTGPSIGCPDVQNEQGWVDSQLTSLVKQYLETVDELPHHFQLHFMHAAEILGYKHPVKATRDWWNLTYCMLVNDMHLFPESEKMMDERLGDKESSWRAREVVTAANPGE